VDVTPDKLEKIVVDNSNRDLPMDDDDEKKIDLADRGKKRQRRDDCDCERPIEKRQRAALDKGKEALDDDRGEALPFEAPPSWCADDDLLLKEYIQVYNDFDVLASTVHFSCAVSADALRKRWHDLLYNAKIADDAAQAMAQLPSLSKRLLWTKQEEALLRLEAPNLRGSFQPLFEAHRWALHSSRTTKGLEQHFYRMRRAGNVVDVQADEYDERFAFAKHSDVVTPCIEQYLLDNEAALAAKEKEDQVKAGDDEKDNVNGEKEEIVKASDDDEKHNVNGEKEDQVKTSNGGCKSIGENARFDIGDFGGMLTARVPLLLPENEADQRNANKRYDDAEQMRRSEYVRLECRLRQDEALIPELAGWSDAAIAKLCGRTLVYWIQSASIIVGRSAGDVDDDDDDSNNNDDDDVDVDLRIERADESAKALMARIYVKHDGCFHVRNISDCEQLAINGVALAPGARRRLAHNSLVQFGKLALLFQVNPTFRPLP
jgi:N-terminal region of micro-spherule protein